MFLDQTVRPRAHHAASGSPPWLVGVGFVLGLAAGSWIPVRGHVPSTGPVAAPAVPASSALSATPMSWSREGNPAMRQSVEVMRVIDGDTFEARVHLWPGLEMTTRVRLRGIDAPEIKGACAEEQRMAETATEALRTQLAEGDVVIFDIGPDKYNGRVVADAATRQTPSVASALLASGHARAYRGGKRGGWCGAARH